MEAFRMQDHLQTTPNNPNRPDETAAEREALTPDQTAAATDDHTRASLCGAAQTEGMTESDAGLEDASAVVRTEDADSSAAIEPAGQPAVLGSGQSDRVDAILAEIEASRTLAEAQPSTPDTDSPPSVASTESRQNPEPADKTRSQSEQVSEISATSKKTAKSNGKKRRKPKEPAIKTALKRVFPWRGDRPLEVVRKSVFLTSVITIGVCGCLITNYYYDLYVAKQQYDDLQRRIEEARNNRGFSDSSSVGDPTAGDEMVYYDYNEIADTLLPVNPDTVGYIEIPGTMVSYPVVQKKSSDININTNDYYLYRDFYQSHNKSGCIYMDYRCHFDEVVDHRLNTPNSENLVIYGHNMKNESMFGSLKQYMRNYGWYSDHPIIKLSSLYKEYNYKIFAVFLVDSSDTTSEYAFDCWNVFDFEDETDFYTFVNAAKRRTIITNDVDVQYGDQLLTLYTCNGTIAEGKLIIMARMVRDGEDPYAGTENGQKNDNILWPKTYYDYKNETYDPEDFVPYPLETTSGE